MQRIICAAVAFLGACDGAERGTLTKSISASAGENFAWLPPIVTPPPELVGTFDPAASPVVTVTASTLIATYTMTSGPGSETVRLDDVGQAYVVNFHARQFALAPATPIRIQVLVDGRVLGVADVVVDRGTNLPIKFWLGLCASVVCEAQDVCHDAGTCEPWTGTCSQPRKPGHCFEDVAQVAGGLAFTLAVKADGTAWSWGQNSVGQLGDGTGTPRLSPGPIACGATAGDDAHCSPDGQLRGVASVSAGNSIALAVLDDGTVVAWGAQSRFAAASNSSTPVYAVCGPAGGPHCDASGRLVNVKQAQAGFSHVVALHHDGAVVAWGTNNNGNLGNDKTGQTSNFPVQVEGLTGGSGVTAIVAGANFSLAVKADGTMVAWGTNLTGQLGDGTTLERARPVPVKCVAGSAFCSSDGHLEGVVAASAANGFSLAQLSDGTLLSWGNNANNQLGDGTSVTQRTLPGDVCAPGAAPPCSRDRGNHLRDVTMTFGSGQGTSGHAVLQGGSLVSWGLNGNGQLGDGTTTQRSIPVVVSGARPRLISAGDRHTLAITTDGDLLSWGSNGSGQLGNGTIFAEATPVQAAGLGSGSGVTAIAAQDSFAMARETDGTVLTWGSNASGQLGDGTAENANAPVHVVCRAGDTPGSTFCSSEGHLQGVSAISAGNSGLAIALLDDGSVVTWGNNANGQLGDGTVTQRNRPAHVCALGHLGGCPDGDILRGVSAIASGGSWAVARLGDGSLVSWGNNANGFLGDGTTVQRNAPVRVICRAGDTSAFCSSAQHLQGVDAIAAGNNAAFALMADHTVLGWGLNLSAQIGDGTTINRSRPVNLCGVGQTAPCTGAKVLAGVTAIAGHSQGGFAQVTVDGTFAYVGWGTNPSGGLGNGAIGNALTPVHICAVGASAPCSPALGNILRGVSAVVGGSLAGYALLDDASVLGFGANSNGQLGDGTFVSRTIPAPVVGLGSGSGVIALAAGAGTAVALRGDGQVLTWGANDLGQLGDGASFTSTYVPGFVLAAP